MKTILAIAVTAATLFTSSVFAADAKQTINRFAEINILLGYNDGSSISLSLQEYRGPYSSETFKLYKDANDDLTTKRPALQKELNKMDSSFERHIANENCLNLLTELKTTSRGLGMVLGMHNIHSTNEEDISLSAAKQSLEELNSELKSKASSVCEKSLKNLNF